MTSQQTITFEKMYPNGICHVKKNHYTRMVEFFDINYGLLDEADQVDVIGMYSKFLNYFDPSIKCELFLFNRHVNEETLRSRFDIPMQGDDFDDIREEF